jgi:hypothetical protein
LLPFQIEWQSPCPFLSRKCSFNREHKTF